MILFEKTYDGNSLCDTNRDIMEVFDEKFNPSAFSLEVDEHGIITDKLTVSVQVGDDPMNLTAIESSYGWILNTDGKLHALTAGDHGYEDTGINMGKNLALVERSPEPLPVGTLCRLMDSCPSEIEDEKDMQRLIDVLWKELVNEFETV